MFFVDGHMMQGIIFIPNGVARSAILRKSDIDEIDCVTNADGFTPNFLSRDTLLMILVGEDKYNSISLLM